MLHSISRRGADELNFGLAIVFAFFVTDSFAAVDASRLSGRDAALRLHRRTRLYPSSGAAIGGIQGSAERLEAGNAARRTGSRSVVVGLS